MFIGILNQNFFSVLVSSEWMDLVDWMRERERERERLARFGSLPGGEQERLAILNSFAAGAMKRWITKIARLLATLGAHGVRRGGMIFNNKKLAIMHAIMRAGRCLRGIGRRALLAAQWKRCRLFCSTAFVRRLLLHRLSPWCVPVDETRHRRCQTRVCNMSSCVFYSATVRATRHAFIRVSFEFGKGQ